MITSTVEVIALPKKKKESKASYVLMKRFLILLLFGSALVIIASGNSHQSVVTYNMNRTKSLEAMHIVTKYNNILEEQTPTLVESMDEIVSLGSEEPIIFYGTMTGYGPDCVGCGGRVGCPPRQDVRNGNIYFEDATYGTVRIVAADQQIPCGTVVRISNFAFSDEPIIAVVLDRGGAINGKTMDLLYTSEAETRQIGRQYHIQFEIMRWGW